MGHEKKIKDKKLKNIVIYNFTYHEDIDKDSTQTRNINKNWNVNEIFFLQEKNCEMGQWGQGTCSTSKASHPYLEEKT